MIDGKITDFTPKDFSSEEQRELYAYWLKIKGNKSMPSRSDLDPIDIPKLLSGIWMADVIYEDPIRFGIRLFGTNLVKAFQRDGTKFRLDDFFFTGDMENRMRDLVETKKAYYYRGKFPIISEDYKEFSTLTLPLSSDGNRVDITISYVHLMP